MEILEIIAILACSVFAGAAIYITVVEHPARLACGTALAATVFGPSYKRAAVIQAALALLATLAGVAVAINGGAGLWFVGACLIFLMSGKPPGYGCTITPRQRCTA